MVPAAYSHAVCVCVHAVQVALYLANCFPFFPDEVVRTVQYTYTPCSTESHHTVNVLTEQYTSLRTIAHLANSGGTHTHGAVHSHMTHFVTTIACSVATSIITASSPPHKGRRTVLGGKRRFVCVCVCVCVCVSVSVCLYLCRRCYKQQRRSIIARLPQGALFDRDPGHHSWSARLQAVQYIVHVSTQARR